MACGSSKCGGCKTGCGSNKTGITITNEVTSTEDILGMYGQLNRLVRTFLEGAPLSQTKVLIPQIESKLNEIDSAVFSNAAIEHKKNKGE